jgi:hypothetical protein
MNIPKQRKREEQKSGIACNTADSLNMLLVKPRMQERLYQLAASLLAEISSS